MKSTSTIEKPHVDNRRFRRAHLVLAASMLVMGACGIIYEYTLSVLGNNLMGSSHEQIFVIIGIMLFAMGVGAALQRHISGNLVDTFLGLELLLGLLGGLSPMLIYVAFVFVASYQIVLFSLALLIGVFIGLEIPLLIRINTEYTKSLRTNLASILCMDYVGALIGALLFAYVLLVTFSMPRIAVALGCVNTLIAAFGLWYFWPLVRRRFTLTLGSLVTLIVLGVVFARADAWVVHLEQRCYHDPIVYRETSRYQHIVLTRRNDRMRLYINGHLQFSSRDERIYHELLVHVPMTAAAARTRVLILGGGDGLALREVLRYPDVREVTLVDIDPAVIELAATHSGLVELNEASLHDARVSTVVSGAVSPGERIEVSRPTKLAGLLLDDREYRLANVHVVNVDADLFLREINGRYDVALLDFPDPSTVELAKLYSVDFYRRLAGVLHAHSVLSVQSSSPVHARSVFLCIGETLRGAGFEVRPYHESVPSFGEWGWYLAWPAPVEVPGTPMTRLQDTERLLVRTRYLTPQLMRAAFEFGLGWLDGAEELDVNTKMRPALVRYYREAWLEERG